jgi:hypothetical protein
MAQPAEAPKPDIRPLALAMARMLANVWRAEQERAEKEAS